MGLICRELGPFSLSFFDLFSSLYVIYSLKSVPSSLFPSFSFQTPIDHRSALNVLQLKTCGIFSFASIISFLAVLVTVRGQQKEREAESCSY